MKTALGKRVAAVGILILIIIACVYVARGPIARFAAAKILGSVTGTNVAFGGVSLHGGHATITNMTMSAHGERLAFIPRIEIAYNLHELIGKSRHKYGLHAITVYDPQITVVHNPDGTYNLPKLPKGGPSKGGGAPLNLSLRVINGSVHVRDDTRVDPSARRLAIDDVNFNASVHTDSRTQYSASMAYVVGAASYPIIGKGVIDAPSGFTLHHWTAARVPLPQLVNYALNNANIRMQAGYLDRLDARYSGAISASALMTGGRVRMQGVSAPIADVHGPMDVTSAGLTTPGIIALVAGSPVTVAGGIYDLKAPKFRLTVRAHSDLSRVKQMAAAAAKLPMRGPVDLSMLVTGPVRAPLAFISLRSPQILYRDMPLHDAGGTIAFDGKTATILNFGLRYGGFDLGARGRVALQKERNAIETVARIAGPSDDIPYASAIAPDMQLQGLLLATGNDLKRIDTHGVVSGSASAQHLAGIFSVAENGVGDVDVSLQNTAGAPQDVLAARIGLDRPHGTMAALVRADRLRVVPARLADLPGLNFKSPPPVRATLSGNLFAATQRNRIGLLGDLKVGDASFGTLSIAQAHARFAGSPGNIGIPTFVARGSFGTLSAKGSITGTNHIALQGRFHGSLAALGAVAGHLPAEGTVDAPIALAYNGSGSIAQISDARFVHASVRGIPIDGLSATIGTQGSSLRVYAARARIAHSASALAAGTVGAGGSDLALSIANLNLAELRGAGVPLSGGYANAAVTARGTLQAPSLSGALMLDRARYGAYPVMGDAAFAYGGSTLDVRDALVGLGPAFVAIDGNVGGVRMGAPIDPQYNLDARLRAADAHTLIALAQPKLSKQSIEGSIDADVHVGGAGRTPMVSGAFDVPEGSVHGLAFRSLSGTIAGNARNLRVQGGHVTIGSTRVAFAAGVAPRSLSANISAPHANLADFNDYFDTGDTLAGSGNLALALATTGTSFSGRGKVDLGGVRFRRFDIGNAVANFHSAGHTLSLVADVGGATGRAHVAGTITVAQFALGPKLAQNANMNLMASVSDLQLGSWLPLMGMTAPVTGTLDADATVRGRYPDVSLGARAAVHDGVVGRVQLAQAQVALSAQGGRGRITQALVRVPYLQADGSGTFGLHDRDPLALAFHATSPDLGKLMTSVSGKPFDASGTLDTTLRVNGTRADPQVRDDFTLASLRYAKFTVPKVWGTLAGNARTIALVHGEVDMKRGRILAASGTAPLRLRANAPVSFDLAVDNVDFSDFQDALPKGYRLAGTMGGQMHVRGTMDAPQLDGAIAVHNGYFVGPIDQNPIQKMNGTLAFAGNTVAIRSLHADVGGGTMDMTASAVVPNFRSPKNATFTSHIVASGAQFNSPKYFRGKVNADVTASRAAGGIPTIAGSVDLPSARIPLTAFWNPHPPKTNAKPPFPLAFNLRANVGNDVRVQSTGVDVGAQGSVVVAGTLANPTLNGSFTSTGGTVDFVRRFAVQSAEVHFSPDNGIMPYVNAVATTQISNPLTYIALHVSGLAPNNMQISFDSEPPYDRAQILAMLSGVSNLNATGGGMGSVSGGNVLANLASSQLNGYFTQQLLEPLSAALGNALGLQNLQLTDDFTSGFGVSAAKAFGKHITAVYTASLGEPQRRSLTISAHHGNSTSFDLMFYSVDSPPLLAATNQTNLFGFNDLANSTTLAPFVGTNGYQVLYSHRFN